MAAWRLAQSGLRVLVLERGDWFRPEDSTARSVRWEQRPNPLQVGGLHSDPTLVIERGAPIPAGREGAQGTTARGETVVFTYRGPFRYFRAHGVGGSTLHYEGEAHRFPPHAFRPATLFGSGVDWPLDYQELAPWYGLAERLLHVAGDPENPFKAPREDYSLPAHEATPRRRWMDRGAARLGWRNLANPLALPSRATPDGGACRHSGQCARGCPFGAKSSTDRLLWRGVLNGNVSVVTGARVTRLETRGRRVVALHYRHGGRDQVVNAGRFILAAGAVETPRLLLVSDSGMFPNGPGNDHDQVGRHLLETVFVSRAFRADRDIESWRGPPLDSRVWDFNRPDPERGVHGFTLAASAGSRRFRGPMRFALAEPGIGRAHKEAVRSRFGRGVWITGVTDHQPRADNRLLLSSQTDTDGIPKMAIRTDYGELELGTIAEMRRRIDTLADACGVTDAGETRSSYPQPATTHIGGTCRMGRDPGDSVTDRFGRVHGTENLFVADGSLLPGQGMGDSPSLTIQALALRCADAMSGQEG